MTINMALGRTFVEGTSFDNLNFVRLLNGHYVIYTGWSEPIYNETEFVGFADYDAFIGDTYPLRQWFRDNGFDWNAERHMWVRKNETSVTGSYMTRLGLTNAPAHKHRAVYQSIALAYAEKSERFDAVMWVWEQVFLHAELSGDLNWQDCERAGDILREIRATGKEMASLPHNDPRINELVELAAKADAGSGEYKSVNTAVINATE